MVVVEVDMGASLAQFQEAIRQRLGILQEQQRIIVVGEPLSPVRSSKMRTDRLFWERLIYRLAEVSSVRQASPHA